MPLGPTTARCSPRGRVRSRSVDDGLGGGAVGEGEGGEAEGGGVGVRVAGRGAGARYGAAPGAGSRVGSGAGSGVSRRRTTASREPLVPRPWTRLCRAGQQGLGDVGEGADQGARGDAAGEEPGRGGEQQDERELAADGEGRHAQDAPAGEGARGPHFGVDAAAQRRRRRRSSAPAAVMSRSPGQTVPSRSASASSATRNASCRRASGRSVAANRATPASERRPHDQQEQRGEREQSDQRARPP